MLRAPLWTAIAGSAVLVSSANAGLIGVPDTFAVNSIGFSSDGVVRGGFSVIAQDIYQVPFGDNFAPSPDLIVEIPDAEFDSYVAFGGQPATSSAFGINPPQTPDGFDNATGFFDQPNTLLGGVSSLAEEPGQSQVNPFTGLQSFFFARITVPTGNEVSGAVFVDIAGQDQQFFNIEQFDATDSGVGPTPLRGFREFRVVSQKSKSNQELSLFTTSRGDTGFFDTYDLYIEFVPAPSTAVALLGAGGLTLVRRRR